MSWAAVAAFIKTAWDKFGKEGIAVLGVVMVMGYINILHRSIDRSRTEVSELKSSLKGLEASLFIMEQSNASMERLMEEQARILSGMYDREYEAEKIFIDRVHKHTEIVREYVSDPDNPGKSKAYWDSEEELWQSIFE